MNSGSSKLCESGVNRLYIKTLLVAVLSVFSVLIAVLACGQAEEVSLFSVTLLPEQVESAIPGQKCVFLLQITDEEEGLGRGEAVSIFASCSGMPVTVTPDSILPGEVAEVIVIPDEESAGETLTVIALGERRKVAVPAASILQVNEGTDDIFVTATEIRDNFISWLMVNHPGLGITDETAWEGTIIRPDDTQVMFYLFFSTDWEMGITWNATAPPYDRASIYLRERLYQAAPLYAFEIDSWSGGGVPLPIDPPQSVWR